MIDGIPKGQCWCHRCTNPEIMRRLCEATKHWQVEGAAEVSYLMATRGSSFSQTRRKTVGQMGLLRSKGTQWTEFSWTGEPQVFGFHRKETTNDLDDQNGSPILRSSCSCCSNLNCWWLHHHFCYVPACLLLNSQILLLKHHVCCQLPSFCYSIPHLCDLIPHWCDLLPMFAA